MNTLMRVLAWGLALVIVMLPVVGVLNGWIASEKWAINRLSVTAEYERVSQEQIQSAIAKHVSKGFFALDVDSINEAVSSIPWVAKSSIRKRWPDTLEVDVQEHHVYARWNDDKLISEHGQVFSAPGGQQVSGVPLFYGPEGRLADVLKFYESARTQMEGTGLFVVETRMSERGSYSVVLNDGSEVMIGRTEPEQRFQRFVSLLPRFFHTGTQAMRFADLRYANGVSIIWQAPPNEQEDDSA